MSKKHDWSGLLKDILTDHPRIDWLLLVENTCIMLVLSVVVGFILLMIIGPPDKWEDKEDGS